MEGGTCSVTASLPTSDRKGVGGGKGVWGKGLVWCLNLVGIPMTRECPLLVGKETLGSSHVWCST